MNIVLFQEFPKNNVIPLNDNRAKHILEILKLKVGDLFKMGIVNRTEGTAEILNISDNGIEFSYVERCKPTLYPVTLLVAQVRPICMKRILREAVSLGCERIILTGSQTSEKSYLSSNLYKTDEYKDYLLDGAMQSSYAGVPQVIFAENVKQAIQCVQNKESSLIMLDNVVGSVQLSKIEVKKSAVLAIGPERGWSDYERKLFLESGYCSALIGNRVLRTETACTAAISVLLNTSTLTDFPVQCCI